MISGVYVLLYEGFEKSMMEKGNFGVKRVFRNAIMGEFTGGIKK